MPKKKEEVTEKDLVTKYKLPSPQRQTQIVNQHTHVIAEAKALKITSAVKAQEAADFRNALKSAEKKIDMIFEDSIKSAKEAETAAKTARKKITEIADSLKDPFVTARKDLDSKLLDFETKESERLAKLEEAANSKNKKPEDIPKVKTQVNRASVSGITYVDNWKAEITDFSKLPDEYKIPDEVKLNKLARELKEDFNIAGAKAVNFKYAR